jgi:hypothetical protein
LYICSFKQLKIEKTEKMKKIIRILGVTLSVLVLASCDKGGEPNNGLPEVTPSSLLGSYKFSTVSSSKPIDTNKDGYFTQDLLEDGYNACEFDNTIEITQSSFSILKKGVPCNTDEKNEIYEYKLKDYYWDNNGAFANNPIKRKGIFLYENGVVIDTLKNIYILETKELSYARYDRFLKQDILIKLTSK